MALCDTVGGAKRAGRTALRHQNPASLILSGEGSRNE
jgi:hypothetical protein